MKKTISLLCLSMAIATSFAQLKVDSLGRVGIGYLGTPQSQLSIGSSGNSNYVMSLSNSDKNGLYIESSNGYTGLNIGMICANQGNNTGINIMPVGGTRTTGTTYGIKAYSGVSKSSYVVVNNKYSQRKSVNKQGNASNRRICHWNQHHSLCNGKSLSDCI